MQPTTIIGYNAYTTSHTVKEIHHTHTHCGATVRLSPREHNNVTFQFFKDEYTCIVCVVVTC